MNQATPGPAVIPIFYGYQRGEKREVIGVAGRRRIFPQHDVRGRTVQIIIALYVYRKGRKRVGGF